MKRTKTIFVTLANNKPKGIFTNKEDMPTSFEEVTVDLDKWNEGVISVSNFRKYVVIPKENFSREEVAALLADMYMNTAGSYNDYGQYASDYNDEGWAASKKIMDGY